MANSTPKWYEKNRDLLDREVGAMKIFFPNFYLGKKDDGRLAWIGRLKPGFLPDVAWEVIAVYNENYPTPDDGGNIRISLQNPTLEELCKTLGWTPHHMIKGHEGLYICTAEKNAINSRTTAAKALTWAAEWLGCLEMVMIGHMTLEEFNKL
ncbi:MAG: hypothetical protein HUK22_04835 [Thermoguttaceae bacterium]|nr:hypothetical protein [Thermoguttaceae bacterium]